VRGGFGASREEAAAERERDRERGDGSEAPHDAIIRSMRPSRRVRRRGTGETSDAWAERLAGALGPWFHEHQRDLSFRRTRDPWAIWVSEVMLQQTRVETVERYYSAFVQRFPDVGTLAAADESDVLQAWSGLGYYRRARLLYKGARFVAEHHGGVVPQEADALRSIPGVGPYTAGAIGSIAFDRPVPLVDGNVARVMSRLFALRSPSEQAATARAHPGRVEAVLKKGQPRVLAQALMELGATICTPRSPRCDACPVRDVCAAHAQDLVDAIPAPKPRKVLPIQRFAALLVEHDGARLFVRRPSEGLLADMWCLPLVPLAEDEHAPSAAAMKHMLDGRVRLHDPAGALVRHVFTHRIWELSVIPASASSRVGVRGLEDDRHAWAAPGQVPAGGVPTLTRKLLARAP
jgi:A/G-specific adenine glycosylase